jgi:hypothetical protein
LIANDVPKNVTPEAARFLFKSPAVATEETISPDWKSIYIASPTPKLRSQTNSNERKRMQNERKRTQAVVMLPADLLSARPTFAPQYAVEYGGEYSCSNMISRIPYKIQTFLYCLSIPNGQARRRHSQP